MSGVLGGTLHTRKITLKNIKTMKPKVLAFTGKKGHGKSTARNAAEIALHDLGYKTLRINFKDALIETMRRQLPNTLNLIGQVYNLDVDGLFEHKPEIMRSLMQEFGTEIYRGLEDNWWVNQFLEKVAKVEEGTIVITDDVRFLNEAKTIETFGGMIVRINRLNYEDNSNTNHQSETEMDKIEPHARITEETKEALEQGMKQIVRMIYA